MTCCRPPKDAGASVPVRKLAELATDLFPEDAPEEAEQATALLLRLAAAARPRAGVLPLIPHRLHLLARAPEGLSLCLHPECSGPRERKLDGLGCVQSPADRCRWCGHILLPIYRCIHCGQWMLAAHEASETCVLEPGYYAASPSQRMYYLVQEVIDGDGTANREQVVVDSSNGEIRGYGAKGTPLWKAPTQVVKDKRIQVCPTCRSEWSQTSDNGEEEHDTPDWRRPCRPLDGGRSLALSVIAETALHDLPPFPEDSRHWKPAGGRRLLAFSDSRAAAARLGPLLTQQHEMQVLRAAIARCIESLGSTELAKYYKKERTEKEQKLKQVTDLQVKTTLKREIEELKKKEQEARSGTPFDNFCTLVAEREELQQLLDRESAEQHTAERYQQSDWKRNFEEIHRHIQGLIGCEMRGPNKQRTAIESIGLIDVVYPGLSEARIPPTFEEKLPKQIREQLSNIWSDVLALLLDSVRADGCVSWSKEDESRTWLGQSLLDNRWLTRTESGWGARPFVGKTHKTRKTRKTRKTHKTRKQLRWRFAAQILEAAGCPKEHVERLSVRLLEEVFDQLVRLSDTQRISWLRVNNHHQVGKEKADVALQVLLDKLAVRRPERLYLCAATQTVWTRCALGWAPIKGCTGTLRETNHAELDQHPRWGRVRREYRDSPIFQLGLWAEEHSAQLTPRENRRLQDLFKEGIRNVLSSTTTMELGVDIGGLSCVLLGNVPPGPTNHRQRAGRAGRRSDGSAVVITFVRSSEYDRQVFHRFGDFLTKELRRPVVLMDRTRVIERHLRAVLFSDFFVAHQHGPTGTMQAFGFMGKFCGKCYPEYWKHQSSKPKWEPDQPAIADEFPKYLEKLLDQPDARDRLATLAVGTTCENINRPAEWKAFVHAAKEAYKNALDAWYYDDYGQLRDAWESIGAEPMETDNHKTAKANSIRYDVKTLCDITVIGWMAERGFLPRYGFPINLQKLSVRQAGDKRREAKNAEGDSSRTDAGVSHERYRLERSALLALSEYVPGSRVIVGGRVAVSRGLRKHWTDNNIADALGLKYHTLRCENGHEYTGVTKDRRCLFCGSAAASFQQLLFPRWGYTTAAWEPPKREFDFERVGEQSVCPVGFTEMAHDKIEKTDFAGVRGARAEYRESVELLVRNAGDRGCGFAVCTRCGFAQSERKYENDGVELPGGFETHVSIFSRDPRESCWPKEREGAPVLRNKVLAARERTDMLRIEWPGVQLSDKNAVYSLGRAFVLAGARLLELDERELGMELMPLHDNRLGIVVFDTAPGGMGHCFELLNRDREWIEEAERILYVDEQHDAVCDRACLSCILDYSGQYKAAMMARKKALSLLRQARCGGTSTACDLSRNQLG